MKNSISIIIPSKNRIHDVIRCLESIKAQTMTPNEVIIVDSSDKQELKSAITSFDLNIKYMHAKASLTRARNIGVENSIGDIIIFLDDDVILGKNYIKEIMRVFESNQVDKIGGVTAGSEINNSKNIIKNLFSSGLQYLATLFFITRYGDGKFQLSGMPTMIRDADKITECEFLFGYNMAFRKEIISKFKFDENFHGYSWGEDDDIAYRVSRNYQNYYTPFARLVHAASPSTRGKRYTEMKMGIENHYYLFKKNIPQNFKNNFAFWWSVVGLFVSETIFGVIKMDSKGVRGLMNGMNSILKQALQGKE